MRIGIDIGGVLSKFPEEYKALIKSLVTDHEVFIVTDMSYDVALKVCQNNNILDYISEKNILCADWAADQDNCKAKIYQKYKIDLAVDDRPDYIHTYPKIGLCQMPRPNTNYYSKEWINHDKL